MNRIVTVAALLTVSVLAGCRSHEATSPQAGSVRASDYPDGLSFDAQMEVFYPDRMGRVPDRFDYLWYSCKAICFAEEETDPQLKRYAKQKASEYFKSWTAEHPANMHVHWTSSAENATHMSKRLRAFLDANPKHIRQQDILKAINELQSVEKKGITNN